MKDDIVRIVNRHIARIMTDLETAQCPTVYRDHVKSQLRWLRSDLINAADERGV